jgi:tetratricopeptide (TPR) repeat protein
LGNYGYSQAPRSVTVSTEPGAAVWINDVRYGTADENGKFTARLVPAGRIKLRVRADGYSEGSKTLLPAQKGAVPITLVKTDDAAWLAFQEGERQSLLDRDKAITAYRNAVTLRPNFPEAYAALARILLEQGKYDAAETAIRSARKYRVAYPEATAILGRLYKDTGDEAKAIATFRKAITEGGGYQPEAYTGLGLIYKDKAEASAAEGDYAGEAANYTESAKNFAKAADQLASAPDAPVLYQLLGLTYEKQKRYKEAIAVYQKFLLMFPDSVEAEAVRSFITQLEKQMDEPK